MKAVIQRVSRARVLVGTNLISSIEKGLLILLGVRHDDCQEDVSAIVNKIINLRIFEDLNGKMNLSLKDVKGELLVVSQFTLLANLDKGRRPSFKDAAEPEQAKDFYEKVIAELKLNNIKVQEGKFKEHMQIELVNDGPVTITIDTRS